MRTTRVAKVGTLLIIIALLPWGCWKLWDGTRTWFFVRELPISLSEGSHYSTPVIRPNMDALYSVYISAHYASKEYANPRSDTALECQIGIKRTELCPSEPVWRFRWELSDNGQTSHGDSREEIGTGWGIDSAGNFGREIGTFNAKAGHRYKFDLDVLFDNLDTNIVNPRLTVAVSDYHAESSLFITGLMTRICGITATVGILMVLASLVYQRVRAGRVQV